jgi:hypothetical protein
MKGETKKMSRALLAFYKATIVPMVRWSFEPGGFLLDLDDIRNPVEIDPTRVLTRIALLDSEFDDSFIYPVKMRKNAEGMNAARKLAPAPKPSDFAISLAACIQVAAGTCPLCGHEEEEEFSNEKESDASKKHPLLIIFRSAFVMYSIDNSEVYIHSFSSQQCISRTIMTFAEGFTVTKALQTFDQTP